MRKYLVVVSLAALTTLALLAVEGASLDAQQNAKCYMKQGGAEFVASTGCKINMTGGNLVANGTPSASLVSTPIATAAATYNPVQVAELGAQVKNLKDALLAAGILSTPTSTPTPTPTP